MIWNMYKKELRSYLRNPFQLVFTLGFPLIFVLLMGYTMSNVIGKNASIESEEELCVLYMVEDGAGQEAIMNFEMFKTFAEEGMEVVWQEVTDFEASKELVNSNDAIALIRVSEEGFYYYRSPYNEPTASKVLRAAYNNMLGEFAAISESQVTSTIVEAEKVDSYTYFTFAELGFIMFYISLIVGQSVFGDKDTKAFRRIYISDASVNGYVAVKVALGITISVVQIVEVYLLSTLALDVNWGNRMWLIVLTYLCLGLFSSVMGAVMGVFSKSRADMSDKILIISILVGLLGGGLTPVTFLESYKVLSYICKISPLYWITNGTVSLAGNQSTNEHFIGMVVCLMLSAVILLIYAKKRQKEQEKGVFLYE
ncbi:MAG: ABC transporter permease [Lachnospiraceae bacterium]|nr:ABC transporter permease [Lachnospiraceae bacterium]